MTHILAVLAVVSSLVFGYYLLRFIQADTFIWMLWVVSWIFTFLFDLARIVEEEE